MIESAMELCVECDSRAGEVWLSTKEGRRWLCHPCVFELEEAGLIIEFQQEERSEGKS